MIFNVKRKDLLAQTKKAMAAATYAGVLQILGGIHIEADERSGLLRLFSTNLEVSIRVNMPAAIEKSGEIVVDSRLFKNILEKLSGEDVYIESKSGYLRITSETSFFEIPALPGEYPAIEIPVPGATVSVTGLRSLTKQTAFAASADDTRAALKCVNLVLSQDGISATATNGFCVSLVEGDRDCVGKISLLIPASSLKLLAAISADSDVFDMGITGDGGKSVVFDDGMLLFSARLIVGDFPEITTLFDGFTPALEAHIDVTTLKNGLENIRVLSTQGKRVGIQFMEDGLQLSCRDEESSGSMFVKSYVKKPDPKSWPFMLSSLSSCLSVLSGDITLGISSQGTLMLTNGKMKYMQIGLMEKIASTTERSSKRAHTQKSAA